MTRSFSKLRNGLAAVAILGCLAFGASQAFATSKAGTAPQVNGCNQCRAECPGFGGKYIAGRCLCCG